MIATIMLALVGSGEYLPPMEPVDRFLIGRLPGPPKVVCLPTAAGTEGPERISYWNDLGVKHFDSLGAEVEAVPVIDRVSADDPALARHIRDANFVYLSGGRPDYLYRTLNGSLAWEAIQAVLAEGGVLAGCSAGAMVMGERIAGFLRPSPAFGLLPGSVIIPHYDEVPEWVVRGLKPLAAGGLTVYGIPAYTALVVDQNNLRDILSTSGTLSVSKQPGVSEPARDALKVVGRGPVTVWGKDGKRQLYQA
jgi:cyanophycinase